MCQSRSKLEMPGEAMTIERHTDPWGRTPRRRRNAVLAVALATHAALVLTMLHARTRRPDAAEPAVLEATIWLPETRRPTPAAALPPAVPRVTRLRSLPQPVAADVHAIKAPLLEPRPIAQAASAPEPPASAASAPLNLTLTRDQLRTVIAGSRPTLAQSLARGPAPSSLERIGGDDSYSEKPLPGGETEVHSHGGCFKMVPTPASKYDPFNHGGALPGNCN